jgi:hypothetical protein
MIPPQAQRFTAGMKHNFPQVFQWLLHVFFVGLMLGTTRIVTAPLAEQEFGLAKG